MPAATMGANENFLSYVSKSEPERKKKKKMEKVRG